MAQIFLFLLCLQLALAQQPQSQDVQPPSTQAARPGTNILSDLSDFILNVDEAVAKLVSPRTGEPISDQKPPSNPATDYLSRLRENYRNAIRKLGTPNKTPEIKTSDFPVQIPEFPKVPDLPIQIPKIPEFPVKTPDFSMSSDVFGMDMRSLGHKTSLDINLPLLPMKISVSAKGAGIPTVAPVEIPAAVSQDVSVGEGLTKRQGYAASRESSDESREDVDVPVVSQDEVSDVSKRKSGAASPESYDGGLEDVEEDVRMRPVDGISSMVEVETNQDVENPQFTGRLLGAMMYDVDAQDQAIKGLMKAFGKPLLDNNLAPNRILQGLRKYLKTERSPANGRELPEMQTTTAERSEMDDAVSLDSSWYDVKDADMTNNIEFYLQGKK